MTSPSLLNEGLPVNVAEPERIVSLAGGLACASAAVMGRNAATPFLLLAAGLLIHRGVTGRCGVYRKLNLNTAPATTGVADHAGLKVEQSIEVGRPPGQVFGYWRKLSNLPKFMPHLLEVRETGPRTSHWKVAGPAGSRVEWDAEIINEHPGSMIAWKTLAGSQVQSAGSVRFDPLNDGARTCVTVLLEYRAPLGKLGAMAATLTRDDPDHQLSHDLARFKKLVETDSDGEA